MGIFPSIFGYSKSSQPPATDTETSDYQFSEPKNTACFTCCHVVKEGADILHVTHDADDEGWQLLCGGDHSEEEAMILGIGEVVSINPSVNELHEMPEGIGAFREKSGSEWKPFKLQ